MYLCRCPHCNTVFQVSIPPDDAFWDNAAYDEDDLLLWVCLSCHQAGQPAVTAADLRTAGHDTSAHKP